VELGGSGDLGHVVSTVDHEAGDFPMLADELVLVAELIRDRDR
jgi:hypothetical protein